MVVIDATMLMLFLRPDVAGPLDARGHPLPHVKERIDHLIETLSDAGTRVLIPTPALSEVLVGVDPQGVPRIIEEIQRESAFRIEPFDERAAIELASMARAEIATGRKKGSSGSSWAKLKFDRQVVAIAKVNQATTIYSDDDDIRRIATAAGIAVVGVADLALPPETAQFDLELKAGSEVKAPKGKVRE